MRAGQPDPEPKPEGPRDSLSQRLRGLRIGEGDWRVAAALGALIAAGPLLTILGANTLAASAQRAAARTEAALAPRLAAAGAREEARRVLAAAVRQPTLGATLDALARALPADASLVRAERTAQGALELDIATPDPDALRAAIRRAPDFARLRDASQRRADAAMIVSMREAGE